MISISIITILSTTSLLVHASPLPSNSLPARSLSVRSFPIAPHVLPLNSELDKRRLSRLRSRSAPLTNIDYGRTFSVSVSLGGQPVNLLVDTGSSNTWSIVAGYTCEEGSDCAFGNAIEVNDTFKIIQGSSFTTSYVDGTHGSGVLANTSVQFAGVEVPTQTIGLVNSVS